jgi:general secretion pathway protein A
MVWRLQPLNREQTIEYVQSRIRVAGGDMWIFEEGALTELHKASGGIPRVINNLCDVAMVMGAADQAAKLDADIVRRAVEEVNPALCPAQTAPGENRT